MKTPNLDRLAATKNAFTPMETLKTSKKPKTSTVDRDQWIAVSPEKNMGSGKPLPLNPTLFQCRPLPLAETR